MEQGQSLLWRFRFLQGRAIEAMGVLRVQDHHRFLAIFKTYHLHKTPYAGRTLGNGVPAVKTNIAVLTFLCRGLTVRRRDATAWTPPDDRAF